MGRDGGGEKEMNNRWPIIVSIFLAVALLLAGQEWLTVRRDNARKAEEARQEEQKQQADHDQFIRQANAAIQAQNAENDHNQKCLDSAKQKPVIERGDFLKECIDKR